MFGLILLLGCSIAKRDVASPSELLFSLKREATQKLIVFVHGFSGDPTLTWTNRSGESWPELMQADDAFRDFNIETIPYQTPLLSRTSTIVEVATRLLRQLEDEGIFSQYNEIYFVAHSMGGLVVKQMLVNLNRPKQIEKLRRVKAVLYISTPAQGANIAELGSLFSVNPQLRDMKPADLNSFLQSLEDQWQDLLRDRGTEIFPQSFCAYETKPTYGTIVVSRVYAATICDQNPFPVDANHTDIVKPASRDADIYRWARARIKEATGLTKNAAIQRKQVGSETSPFTAKATHVRTDDTITLLIAFDRNSGHFDGEVLCLVTDPNNRTYVGSGRMSASGISGLQFVQWYPKSFVGAPALRSGTYTISWILAAEAKHVIATDNFEIP